MNDQDMRDRVAALEKELEAKNAKIKELELEIDDLNTHMRYGTDDL